MNLKLIVPITLALVIASCDMGHFERRYPTRDVSVITVPDGGTLVFSDGQRCVAPCTIKVRREHHLQITAFKEGSIRES